MTRLPQRVGHHVVADAMIEREIVRLPVDRGLTPVLTPSLHGKVARRIFVGGGRLKVKPSLTAATRAYNLPVVRIGGVQVERHGIFVQPIECLHYPSIRDLIQRTKSKAAGVSRSKLRATSQ